MEDYCLGYIFGQTAIVYALQNGSIYVVTEDTSLSSIDFSILDLGEGTQLYAEENGFEAIYYDGKWTLTKTPNDTYVVPETVGGKSIEAVALFHLKGTAVFDRTVELVDLGWGGITDEDAICVNVLDYDFITSLWECAVGSGSLGYVYNLDLSGCGNTLEIPEEILNELEWRDVTIYVTSDVKQKYESYEKIVVKQVQT